MKIITIFAEEKLQLMNTIESNTNEEKRSLSFVEQIVEEDIAEGKNGLHVQTLFPP